MTLDILLEIDYRDVSLISLYLPYRPRTKYSKNQGQYMDITNQNF